MKHIVIIGNGISGITAARTIRQLSDHRITVISSESKYFFSRTALMYVYMGHLRWKDIQPYESWFWVKNNIHLVQDRVTDIDPNLKTLFTQDKRNIKYDSLIIATGSASNALHVPGNHLTGVTGLYSRQDLEYIDSISTGIRRAVITGGGLIGIELAEMFVSRKIPVTFLVRESGFFNLVLPPEESQMVNQHMIDHGVDLRLETELTEINGDENGHVKSVTINSGEQIPSEFTGITIGVHPNVHWLESTDLDINKGILVDEFLKTNLPDIYAIGDCAELRFPSPGRRSIEPVWYTGRMMGESVAHVICGHPTKYLPGLWFNSAKFFDIEYQVYGNIQPQLPVDQKSLFWMHPKDKKSIRINYTPQGVIGFNLMGIRFRQEVCEKWIHGHASIETVIAQLELALFDPEFSANCCEEVRNAYTQMTGISIASAQRRGLNHVFSFLKSTQSTSS